MLKRLNWCAVRLYVKFCCVKNNNETHTVLSVGIINSLSVCLCHMWQYPANIFQSSASQSVVLRCLVAGLNRMKFRRGERRCSGKKMVL